jgi:hypothetical protein
MPKFTPFEKLSKKARKALTDKRRVTWGSFNPATRKPENPKAYKRKKIRDREDDFTGSDLFLFI